LTIETLPDGSAAEIVNAGFVMGEGSPSVTEPPPRLGEHTEEILAWLARDASATRNDQD